MSILKELFEEQEQLDEARPYSMTQSGVDKLKGKVKSYFGSGQVEQGAAETGRMANALWNDFKRAIGRKYGTTPDSVPYSEVATFFKQNKLDSSVLGTNPRRSFTPKDVGTALLKASQIYMDEFGPTEEQGSDEQSAQPEQDKKQDRSAGSEGQYKQGGQQSQSTDQSQGSGLKGQISSLSDSERQQLLRLLS